MENTCGVLNEEGVNSLPDAPMFRRRTLDKQFLQDCKQAVDFVSYRSYTRVHRSRGGSVDDEGYNV